MTPPDDPSTPPVRPWWQLPTWLSITLLVFYEASMIYLLIDVVRAPAGTHPRDLFWLLLAGILFPLLGDSANLYAWWRRRRGR